MNQPTGCTTCCHAPYAYCDRCDLLVGLPGLHVIGVEREPGRLQITVESPSTVMGCPSCGVVAGSHGRRTVRLIDTPCFGAPTVVWWRKRTWVVFGAVVSGGGVHRAGRAGRQAPGDAHHPGLPLGDRTGPTRARLHRRAGRQLGTTWRTVWTSIEPILARAAADESRFAGVTTLGVDEHLWHHVSPRRRGPKELTGMVDLTRDKDGRVRARLLDLVPGRSGTVYKTWLDQRGKTFKAGVEVATLDPFRGYKNAIDDKLADATAVLDAFHVVALAGRAVDEVRRRIQQEIHGHRGRSGNPLYGTPNAFGPLTPTPTQPRDGSLPSKSSPASPPARSPRRSGRHDQIARLGRTLRQWKDAFLAYFDTGRASNGGTESINGLIELHRRIARGFRNRENYRPRMLLIGGGLTLDPPQV